MSVVVANVPSCSSYVSVSEYDVNKANSFDPRKWTYYQDILEAWVPGAVLCGIALLGFLAFITWLLTLCCREHYWKWELEPLPGTWGGPQAPRKRSKCRAFHTLLILSFLLATVGLSVWGLVEGILSTNTSISSFWSVVVDTQYQVGNITATGNAAVDNLDALSNSLPLLLGAAGETVSIPQTPPPLTEIGDDEVGTGPVQIRSVTAVPENVASVVREVQPGLQQIITDARAALAKVKQIGLQGLQDVRVDGEKTSTQVEDTWRYVVIIVFFSLVILLAVLCTLLALHERMPRLAAFFTTLFWLVIALLMGLGAGAMSLGYQVSSDGCLYGEVFSMKVVREKVDNPDPVLYGMQYYFGNVSIPSSQVAQQVYGINITSVLNAATSLGPLNTFLQSERGQAFLAQYPVGSQEYQQLLRFTVTLLSVQSNARMLNKLVQREEFGALYDKSKTWLCCGLSETLRMLWIAWTSTGCAALVLATLVSIRIARLAVFSSS